MQQELTRRVSSLIEAAAKPGARSVLKSRILELAQLAQVVPEQQFLLRTVAKSMTDKVEEAFGPLSLILVLTEPGRRQVYFAVLARLGKMLSGNDSASACQRRELLEDLLLESNEDLVAHAYGSCPPGFVRIITRFGETARTPDAYITLFDLLREAPDLGPALLALPQPSLTDHLIELLAALPRTSQAIRLAKQFEHIEGYRRFMRVYSLLTGGNTLRADHAQRICGGESPARLIERLYHGQPFPPPAVNTLSFRYLANGAELVAASKAFNNCLRNYVAEAMRGERQYYIWEKRGEPAVIFSLNADAPFGWCLSECKLAGNARVPVHLARELESILEFSGVRTTGTLEQMMRHFPSEDEETEMEDLIAQLEDELDAA